MLALPFVSQRLQNRYIVDVSLYGTLDNQVGSQPLKTRQLSYLLGSSHSLANCILLSIRRTQNTTGAYALSSCWSSISLILFNIKSWNIWSMLAAMFKFASILRVRVGTGSSSATFRMPVMVQPGLFPRPGKADGSRQRPRGTVTQSCGQAGRSLAAVILCRKSR